MKTQTVILIGLIFSAAVFMSAKERPVTADEITYNLEKPSLKIVLPEILHEISGLTDFGPTTIACVQDEKGVIFIYDYVKQRIVHKFTFAEDGDYEGITLVNDVLYVLRSDGDLFEISSKSGDQKKVVHYKTQIPAKNNEGLCYDAQNNRLLIGSKVKSGKGKELSDKRFIYAFDLDSKELSKQPAFELNKSEIIKFAKKHDISLPTKKSKKTNKVEVNLKFGVSGISIHPKTKELYVLCAIDYLLLIYDQDGDLKKMLKLDPTDYPQAEGITFYENGDLLISNEGVNKQPTILRFDANK